jgi:nucleoside-diphosphate-sugar epimerase
MSKLNKFLITGGMGFIGSHMAMTLEEKNKEVIIYDLKDNPWFDHEFIKGDIRDRNKLKAAAKDCDCIIDCAGILGSGETFDHINKTIEINILGTQTILDVAKVLKKPVVYVSLKNDWLNPYMISKRTGSQLCRMYHKYLNTPTIVIEALNAYGPRQKWKPVKKMIPTFIMQALTGQPMTIYGDGQQLVDLIYVKDMCEAIYQSIAHQVWGETVEIGTGLPKRVYEVAQIIKSITLSTKNFEILPMRKGEPRHAVALADPSFMVQNLHYYPETSLRGGLTDTIRWYEANK